MSAQKLASPEKSTLEVPGNESNLTPPEKAARSPSCPNSKVQRSGGIWAEEEAYHTHHPSGSTDSDAGSGEGVDSGKSDHDSDSLKSTSSSSSSDIVNRPKKKKKRAKYMFDGIEDSDSGPVDMYDTNKGAKFKESSKTSKSKIASAREQRKKQVQAKAKKGGCTCEEGQKWG